MPLPYILSILILYTFTGFLMNVRSKIYFNFFFNLTSYFFLENFYNYSFLTCFLNVPLGSTPTLHELAERHVGGLTAPRPPNLPYNADKTGDFSFFLFYLYAIYLSAILSASWKPNCEPPETPRTSQHYFITMFKGGPQLVLHYADRYQLLRQAGNRCIFFKRGKKIY